MYALIHDSQLILGPIKWNYRLINSEIEDLEIAYKVAPRDYESVPIQINQNTFILPVIENIPEIDTRFQSLGNFSWSLVEENNILTKIEITYPSIDKTLEQIKYEYKSQVAPIRREKENTTINIDLNGTIISTSTSRENRLAFASKLIASPGPHNFKFDNDVWLQITTTELQYIISQIDIKVQEAFDWEYQKLQEIDACTTGVEVYNVVLR